MLLGLALAGIAGGVAFGLFCYWGVMRIKRRYIPSPQLMLVIGTNAFYYSYGTTHIEPYSQNRTQEEYKLWSIAFNKPRTKAKEAKAKKAKFVDCPVYWTYKAIDKMVIRVAAEGNILR